MSYELHPLASLFPSMPEGERAELKRHIEEHGLLQPITLFKGKVLDGGHRLQICRELGLEPAVRECTEDPLEFVLGANLMRRHLTAGQRAAVAAEIVNMRVGSEKPSQKPNKTPTPPAAGFTQTQAAGAVNVSVKTVEKAAQVKRSDPTLHAQVKAGKITLNQAVQSVRKKVSEAEIVRCESGAIIPSDLVDFWNRRGEIKAMLGTITSMVNRLAEAQKSEDPLYLPVHMASAISKLEYARQEISAGLPYAVCITCQGRARDHCTHCKGIGFQNKTAWGMVSDEAKQFRSAP